MISELNCTIRGYATPDGEAFCMKCAMERFTEDQLEPANNMIEENDAALTEVYISAVWDYDNECCTCGSPLDSTVL